ncbi:hypothetical protein [Robiginitalea aurantiaca]|uniref:Uncharacterized protein n=1 Tax=Robiginitalea aurantiaca TaxID=3056915 RepID=A0ABT7WBE6_9FLAO|nr:hypothetical protein [Robiginitalea aurantiaca]MDM9630246.1 hypothetical protein [Robiginitalea aurantiaca]
MQFPFTFFLTEISKPKDLRKGFTRKRKNPFSISDARINDLYDKYFSTLSPNNESLRFEVESTDFEQIVYLLRVHFQLWIEIDGYQITIYQDFPERFRIIKDVDTENHPHTPISIPKGTIMELSENAYGVVNYSNGIPLTGKILTEAEGVTIAQNPFLQINYPFIEGLH